MGAPLSHPSIDWDIYIYSRYKPSILGTSMTLETITS